MIDLSDEELNMLTEEMNRMHSATALLDPEEEDATELTFDEIEGNDDEGKPLSHLATMELNLEVVFGKRTLTLAELMNLKTGSVVALDNLVGEPADIEVNGTPVAQGEIVVVDDHFGVKVTKIL